MTSGSRRKEEGEQETDLECGDDVDEVGVVVLKEKKTNKISYLDGFLRQSSMLIDTRERMLRELFPSPKKPILLEFSDISFSVESKSGLPFRRKTLRRDILRKISGSVAPGDFLVILGPSGAGKTSLLSILAGRLKSGVTGEVLFNRVPRNKTSYKNHMAFVLQEDLFFSELTVSETLHLTARLVLPSTLTVPEKIAKAEKLIDLFHLRKCANTKVGSPLNKGLSGGEKKRLNIANELLKNPTLVIMDEPTSGLDSNSALQVVFMLSQLAKSGKTVIATLHQPSSQMFSIFDKLLVLADGRVAYHGSAQRSLSYVAELGFKCPPQFNPADHLIGLVEEMPASLTTSSEFQSTELNNYREIVLNAYEKGNYGVRGVPEVLIEANEGETAIPQSLGRKTRSHRYPCGMAEQFYLLFKRGFVQYLSEFIPVFLFFMIIAGLVSIVFWHRGYKEKDIRERSGLIFFVTIYWFIMPVFTALNMLQTEKIVITKERPSRMYRLSAYFLSRSLAHTPLNALIPIGFTCIVYWTTNLNSTAWHFFVFLFFAFLAQLAGQSLGLIFGSYFSSEGEASPFIMILFYISTLVGGFYVALSTVPSWFRWSQYLSIIKYVMDALRINEYRDVSFKLKDGGSISGKEVLRSFDLIWPNSLWPYALVLLVFSLLGALLAYGILRRKTRARK